MKKYVDFFHYSSLIPWALLVANYNNLILSSVLLGFQLFCFFAWVYLENKDVDI